MNIDSILLFLSIFIWFSSVILLTTSKDYYLIVFFHGFIRKVKISSMQCLVLMFSMLPYALDLYSACLVYLSMFLIGRYIGKSDSTLAAMNDSVTGYVNQFTSVVNRFIHTVANRFIHTDSSISIHQYHS